MQANGGANFLDTPRQGVISRSLNWLDAQNAGTFWVVLYLARWPVVQAVGYLQTLLWPSLGSNLQLQSEIGAPNILWAFFLMVILAPALETFVECWIPYALMRRMKHAHSARPWPFILVSAGVMALLHAPYAVPLGFITGFFLAYCYGHFAPRGQKIAFLYTAGYHAAINIVGWTMLVVFA